MKPFPLFILMMTALLIAGSPLYATRVIIGRTIPSDVLERQPLQRVVLPSSSSFSLSRDSRDERQSARTGCCSVGCCSTDAASTPYQMHTADPDEEGNSQHVYIMARFSTGWHRGTATIVGDCLLTAAHCVYRGEPASQIIIAFGMRQVVESGCLCARKIFKYKEKAIINSPLFVVPREYLDGTQPSELDIALITLNKFTPAALLEAGVHAPWYDGVHEVQIESPQGQFSYGSTDFTPGSKYGSVNIKVCTDEELAGIPVTITGYPAYSSNTCRCCRNASYDMFSTQGRVTKVEPNIFLHNSPTVHGHSGAAVCLKSGDDDQTYVVGVHSGGFAVRFTDSVVDFLTEHLDKFNRMGEGSTTS